MNIVDFLKQKKASIEADLENVVALDEKLSDIRAQIALAEKQLGAVPKAKAALSQLLTEILRAKSQLSVLDERTRGDDAASHRNVVIAAACLVASNLGAGDMYLRTQGWTGSNGVWFHPAEAPDGLPVRDALRLRLIREAGPLFAGIEQRLSGAVNVQEAQADINELLKLKPGICAARN